MTTENKTPKEWLELKNQNANEISNDAEQIIKYLSMNKDTVRMFARILQYCHSSHFVRDHDEVEQDNIEWAEQMIEDTKDKIKERGDLHNNFCNSLKQLHK